MHLSIYLLAIETRHVLKLVNYRECLNGDDNI